MSRFRRRLMGLTQLREAKRKDFVRVEYIENTSTAYIDTGVIPNSTYYNVEIKFLNSGNKASTCLYGARDSYKALFYSFWTNADNLNDIRATNGSNEDWKDYDQSIDTNNKVSVFKLNDNTASLTVDDVENTWDITNSAYGATKKIYLFNCNNNNSITPSWNFIGRVYYFKIYHNDILVRDYIPMYQISTDTYGLWDRITEEFYTSPNGIKFTGGARVVEDANGKLYYIKNYISFAGSGKNLVSIGLKPNETDYYETKWYFAGSGRSNFMGARTKSNNNDYQCYGYSKALHIVYDTGNICNYSVTYTNKAYIFKTYFNKKTNQMYAAIYDANKNILAQNKVAKRSGAASVDFFIGKQNGLNNYYPPVNSRMYYFKYWRNHNLVRDMIPVQSVETGEYGFFDKVNLKIYYSSGSADFTGA